jgi:hypothetical protein
MLTMRDPDVEDYVALRDMDATHVGMLSEDDRACLDELGQYLVSTDAFRRFAIWLLHKHFDPIAGEVFVERVLDGPRRTETAPVERSAFSTHGLSPTAVRFDDAIDSGVGVIGMEFAEPADFGAISPLSADDETALAGIADRLLAHGKTERFGVRLIRDPLGLADGEVLFETCDIAQRTLHCSVTERNGLPAHKIVETTWRWKPGLDEAGPTVMQECCVVCVPDYDAGHLWMHGGSNDC